MAKYTTYTKERLADALIELMVEKPLSEISISELADKAQVNRASFYRNFHSKDEILLHSFNARYRRWISRNEEMRSLEGDPYIQARGFFEFMLAERDFLLTLYETGSLGVMLRFLEELIGPTEDDHPQDAFYRSYHAYGAYGVYSEWIRQGMEQTPEEMAALLVYETNNPHGSLIRKEQGA